MSEPEAAKLARRADRLVQVLTAGRAVPTESVIEALREMRDAIGYGICSYYCPACFAAVRSLSTTSAPAQAEPSEPRLPYDVKVGATTFRKGVALSTFVMAAQRWHREAFPDYYTLTDEQKAANFARLQGAAHGEAAQQPGGAA